MRRNTDALIPHRHCHMVRVHLTPNPDRSAIRRILNRVTDQVLNTPESSVVHHQTPPGTPAEETASRWCSVWLSRRPAAFSAIFGSNTSPHSSKGARLQPRKPPAAYQSTPSGCRFSSITARYSSCTVRGQSTSAGAKSPHTLNNRHRRLQLMADHRNKTSSAAPALP